MSRTDPSDVRYGQAVRDDLVTDDTDLVLDPAATEDYWTFPGTEAEAWETAEEFHPALAEADD